MSCWQVSKCKPLTPGLLSALCPRFSPNGRLLLFMSHDAAARSGVHCATAALHTLMWPPISGEASFVHDLRFPAQDFWPNRAF
jgi:hypothetical protein